MSTSSGDVLPAPKPQQRVKKGAVYDRGTHRDPITFNLPSPMIQEQASNLTTEKKIFCRVQAG